MDRMVLPLLAFVILCFSQGAFLKALDTEIYKELREEILKEDHTKSEQESGLFEGDIEIDASTRHALTHGGSIDVRDALRRPIYRWPNGKLYYKFDELLGRRVRRQIHQAIEHIKLHTCIRFQEVDDSYKNNYVKFYQGSGCSSRVGRDWVHKEQKISIGRGCTRLGTIAHEIMHSLGFFHEQSRQDRDKFIKILWSNIGRNHRHNFNKYPANLGTTLGKPYDYHSVMHYSRYAFSNDDEPTIVTKKRRVLIGQRIGLSKWDVYQINKLYGCKEHKSDEVEPFLCLALLHKRGRCTEKMNRLCSRTCSKSDLVTRASLSADVPDDVVFKDFSSANTQD